MLPGRSGDVIVSNVLDPSFFAGRRVFVTGHTGFKGSWLSHMLARAGAEVRGYSLEPPTVPSLFEVAAIGDEVDSVIGDVRDHEALFEALFEFKPEVVLHLAAQPLVLDGYAHPRYTYEVNVMGTVNLLEACRHVDTVASIVNVTTDKVYLNEERAGYGYREDDPLDGYDPYSNSKSCSDLVTHSYYQSFFRDAGVALSAMRAGNVIGGGDFADNRIVPDCVRAALDGVPIAVRNPDSTRPYQHVLEPLFAYLLVAQKQLEDPSLSGSYNVGPDDEDCVTTRQLVELFGDAWGAGFEWVDASSAQDAPHEATFLKLDSSKMKRTFHWAPQWHIDRAIEATVAWSKRYGEGGDVRSVMDEQIDSYIGG